MVCDTCGERPAEYTLTQVVDDEKTTLHLCEQCAAERGIETGSKMLKSPLGDFLASMGSEDEGPAASTADETECEFCGGTLQDFRETGRLGCPHCYVQFEQHLRGLLRRLHGSSAHVGEVFLTPLGEEERNDDGKRRLHDLRERLRQAVDVENFELAAELRDRIRVLDD